MTDSLAMDALLEGRYRIVRLLGQGGMSRVYLAEDARLRKRVAIKENLLTGPESRAQFERESQILASLTHPNLPHVQDHFVDGPTGRQYLVMDYVEGEDLESMVHRTGPLPEATALAWIRQVLDAVEYLHGQNPPVVHRDIKPANIKITPEGRAVLVDFGIAKLYQAGQATGTGARAVTPGYAPPEQYGMSTSPRSDIYSLGATLYTILTGKVPPEAPMRLAGEAALLPMGREAGAAISAATGQAIGVAMSLETSKRWQSAAQLRGALAGGGTVRQVARLPKSRGAVPIRLVVGLLLAVALLNGVLAISVRRGAAQPDPPSSPGSAKDVIAAAAASTATRGAAGIPGTSTPTAAPVATTPPAATPTATAVPSPFATRTPTLVPTAMPVPTLRTTPNVLTLAPGVMLELVRVPAGPFLMGSATSDAEARADEKSQVTVALGEYSIGKYEVTVAQFAAFVKSTGYTGWTAPSGNESHPVKQVSWDDAVAFTKWASQVGGRSVRLPTEAEWEKAARGTDGRKYPWGNEAPDSTRCNSSPNVGGTTPVGKYSPLGDSPYGAADLCGNVLEWTSSLYKGYPYVATDGREDAASRDPRVLRGGSYSLDARLVRSAVRTEDYPGDRGVNVGFRVVVSPIS